MGSATSANSELGNSLTLGAMEEAVKSLHDLGMRPNTIFMNSKQQKTLDELIKNRNVVLFALGAIKESIMGKKVFSFGSLPFTNET